MLVGIIQYLLKIFGLKQSPLRKLFVNIPEPHSFSAKAVSLDSSVRTSKLRPDVGVFSGKKLALRQPRIETLSRTYYLNAHRTHSLRAWNTFATCSPEPYWHPSIRRCPGMTSASRAGCRKRTCRFLAATRTNIVPYLAPACFCRTGELFERSYVT